MTDTVRYAIVGVAGRGHTHVECVDGFDNADLVAGADVVEDHVRAFEDDYGVPGYTDHREMLEEEEIDAVSICTPSGTHADIAIDCMNAGAHVLTEKPYDVHLDRVDAMVEAAAENGVKLSSIFQRRLSEERWTAKRWIDEGRFGDPILADATVKWYRPQSYYEDGWHGTRDLDGGVLLQQAVHFVDLLQWLMGGVESVKAYTDTVAHEMECEDVAAVALEFENGAYGTIEATTAVSGGEDRLEVNGTEGSYNSGTFVLDGDVVEPELEEPPFGGGVRGQIQDFVHAVIEDRPPVVDAEEGRKAVEVVLAAYASADLGREVRIDELRDLEEHTRATPGN